jgi:hypothetical protein
VIDRHGGLRMAGKNAGMAVDHPGGDVVVGKRRHQVTGFKGQGNELRRLSK